MIRRERIEGVRWRLRATRRIWRRGATRDMPLLEDEQVPNGRLDHPHANGTIGRGHVSFSGWALFPSGPCVRVEIWLGGERLGLARLGLPRIDLDTQIDLPGAGFAGFERTFDLSAWPRPDGETEVRAVAVSARGERLELSAPVTVVPKEELERKEEKERKKKKKDEEEDAEVPVRAVVRGEEAIRTLVFTHQLTLGGAQFYLLDLLRVLSESGAIEATVVSTQGGPLRKDLAELGIPSHVTSINPAHGLNAHLGRLAELTSWAEGQGFQAAFVNTATAEAFPGIELAAELGIPAIWAIHESLEPSQLWHGLKPRVRQRAVNGLTEAAAVVFEAEATQRLFEPAAPDGRFLTIPYGLDLEPIEAERDGFDRTATRRKAEVPVDAELVLCVGTVEPRKAQVSLTQAFELIAARHPRARLALVGGRDDENARLLGEYIDGSPLRDRMELVPITPKVQRWYGMADLLVCASDMESLPRTVLEAMAWECPVLATEVFGLPELIEDGETGWLCAPRDVEALAAALDRALGSSAAERARMGRAARALVERRHSLPDYGDKIAALLREAVREAPASGSRRAASA